MSLTSQPLAYTDCYRLFESAAASPNGMRVPFATSTKARYFQMRMNQARVIQRDESRRVYPADHPLYNKSEFDALQVTVREDINSEWWVYVQPAGDWSALAEAEPIPIEERNYPEPLQLTHIKDQANANQSDDLV